MARASCQRAGPDLGAALVELTGEVDGSPEGLERLVPASLPGEDQAEPAQRGGLAGPVPALPKDREGAVVLPLSWV